MELSMSPLTIFLGKLIGIYCIIAALALMAQKQRTVEAVNELIRNPALLLFVEVSALIAGLAMIIAHNVWSGGAFPVVITVLGWLIAIRGGLLLALPRDTILKLFETVRYKERFHIFMGATLILGIYLTVAAFVA
jgi:hypothetical protein